MSREDSSLTALREELTKNYENAITILDNNRFLLQRILDAMPREAVNRISIDGPDFNISASGNKEVLTGCIRALRIHGYISTSKPTSGKSEYYSFFHREGSPPIWFHFTSTSCRRVKIGTKMVEQDIYETVCDEQIYEGAANS